jgi:DNA-binding MarR family transcriptional regulator
VNVQSDRRPTIQVKPATTLLREVMDLTTEFEKHVGNELRVNPTDLEAMEQLITDGALSPTELSKRLGISTAAVTSVIDRLTAVGHVTRAPHPTDRRALLVVPSPGSVAKAMSTLMPMILGIDRALDGLSAAEQATITAYLERVVAVYRAQLPA